jgi:hypothetical protein
VKIKEEKQRRYRAKQKAKKKKPNKQTKPFGAFYKRNEWGKNQSNSRRK